jgi:hypothetical protein
MSGSHSGPAPQTQTAEIDKGGKVEDGRVAQIDVALEELEVGGEVIDLPVTVPRKS